LSNRPLPHEPKRRLYEKIGLGSDSVASNNTMDMFEEMRFAVLMQRGARHRIHAMSAQEAVEMATLGGARTLGMDSEIGSLEAGKRADFCVVQLNDLHTLPAYDPYNALVYSARASDVTLTVIDGKIRCDARLEKDRRFPGVNLLPVRENLLTAARKMRDWRPVT
jgi:5-methylthioadenosine/S-adenosylhomocysteine deaminase